MIRIKAVDEQNILDVCGLTTAQDGIGPPGEGHACCNAISIAEAYYYPEMHPTAIYHNNTLIGFFMYLRAEEEAETATICRFMLDHRFQEKGLEEKAMEHILRGLKIQGVRQVVLLSAHPDEAAENRYRALGFHLTGQTDQGEYRYALEMSPS